MKQVILSIIFSIALLPETFCQSQTDIIRDKDAIHEITRENGVIVHESIEFKKGIEFSVEPRQPKEQIYHEGKDPDRSSSNQHIATTAKAKTAYSPPMRPSIDYNTLNAAPVNEYVEQYLNKYGSIAEEWAEKTLMENPSAFSQETGLVVKYGGKILKGLDLINAIADAKAGKWGTVVCFTLSLTPPPYGLAASSICDITLLTIRIKADENNKE